MVKRILRKYSSPGNQESAIKTVLEQAKLMATDFT